MIKHKMGENGLSNIVKRLASAAGFRDLESSSGADTVRLTNNRPRDLLLPFHTISQDADKADLIRDLSVAIEGEEQFVVYDRLESTEFPFLDERCTELHAYTGTKGTSRLLIISPWILDPDQIEDRLPYKTTLPLEEVPKLDSKNATFVNTLLAYHAQAQRARANESKSFRTATRRLKRDRRSLEQKLTESSEEIQKLASETRRLRVQVEEGSFDELTGLPTKKEWEKEAVKRAKAAVRNKSTFYVLHIDGYRCGLYNKVFDQNLGDQVIARYGAIAYQSMRGGDFVARIGGEEFSAFIDGVDGVKAVARNIKHNSRGMRDFPELENPVYAAHRISKRGRTFFEDSDRTIPVRLDVGAGTFDGNAYQHEARALRGMPPEQVDAIYLSWVKESLATANENMKLQKRRGTNPAIMNLYRSYVFKYPKKSLQDEEVMSKLEAGMRKAGYL